MLRKSESPTSPHPYAQLRSKITLQNDSTKSSQHFQDCRLAQPRQTEFKLQFGSKQTTQSTVMAPEQRNSSTTRVSNPKNSPMYASYIPSRKDELVLSLSLSTGTRTVRFPFTPETTLTELLSHLRGLSGLQNVCFRSGDLMLDHFLTLENQKVGLLRDSQPITLKPHPISTQNFPQNSLKRFHILKCIGAGGFSKVYLGEVYGVFVALKVIDKRILIAQEKALIIQNERKVLLAMDHPFIAKMHYALETDKYVVLALQYCCGGELFYHLKRRRRLKEAEAKFYFLQILAALKALHEKGIVYRDLKPENVILDSDGHIKLADFGLSKFMTEDELTHSFCGSAEYMAPEMLNKSGHNFAIDFYCLGALLYELVTGLPPYYSSNQDILYQNILNSPVQFPEQPPLSPQIRSLLSSLLVKDPDRRLGTLNGANEIISHPWFNGICFSDVTSKKLTPPVKPNLFKYNFDDSEYKAGEFQDMEALRKEREEGDLRVPQLGAFYYESETMRRRREGLKMQHTTPMKKKTNPIKTEPGGGSGGMLGRGAGTTSSQELRELARKTESNTSKLRNNRYFIQPYNKYGSSSPASQNRHESLKYKLPASTKALLHKNETRVTPEGRRQYSQQINAYRAYSKDHIFEGSYDVGKTPKYRLDKYEKYGAALNGSGSKIHQNKHHYEYGHKRPDSPMSGLLKVKTPQSPTGQMTATTSRIQPQLRKGYLNKDKIRNYLTGVYKS